MRGLVIVLLLGTGLFPASCSKKCDDRKPGVKTDCIDEAKATGQPCYTLRYEPVCGCNNITYASPCDAENAGVLRYVAGECKDTRDK